MKKPKKTKPTVADKTRAYADAFPPHPHQQEFLDACIALRADDLVSEADEPMSATEALAMAGAEFDAALIAVLFPPPEGRFYFMWRSSVQARLLVRYTQTVWLGSPGAYGNRQPIHYEGTPQPQPKVQN